MAQYKLDLKIKYTLYADFICWIAKIMRSKKVIRLFKNFKCCDIYLNGKKNQTKYFRDFIK